ncbi:MAG: hypothetical protein ABF326_02230 [Arenicellales bacterium]|jgi:hypothetical protein
MPFWQRSMITLAAMIFVSFLIGLLWQSMFNFGLPSYVSGVVGGLTAVPLWEFLKRVKPKQL